MQRKHTLSSRRLLHPGDTSIILSPASFLNLLHFFGDDDRVALPDLGGAGLLVVEVALVLITVPVY